MKGLRCAVWLAVVVAVALIAQGCTTAAVRPAIQNGMTSSDGEAYRQGIRDALAKLRSGGTPVSASPKQPDTLQYVGPVMQEVWMPARVVGGVLIPAHREWVVVRPGTWQIPSASGQPSETTAHPRGKPGQF